MCISKDYYEVCQELKDLQEKMASLSTKKAEIEQELIKKLGDRDTFTYQHVKITKTVKSSLACPDTKDPGRKILEDWLAEKGLKKYCVNQGIYGPKVTALLKSKTVPEDLKNELKGFLITNVSTSFSYEIVP